MNDRIWLSPPHMGQREMGFVEQAFESNWIAPLGPHVLDFQRKLSDFIQVPHTLALSSGTSALHLALIVLNVKPGDVVICQTETFSASANPICYLGAEPVFVDSEPDTWNMDPDALRICLEHYDKQGAIGKVKAIIVVDLYGMPAQMTPILDIARRFEIPVIEDAAEALGSVYQGRYCGSFGHLGVLSFNGNKIITCSGGGALVSHNETLHEQASYLSAQARDPAPHYEHSEIGYNYRMSNVLAGIGIGQMEVLPDRVLQRRENYQRYLDYFSKWNDMGFRIGFQPEPDGCYSNRWLTCIQIDPQKNGGLSSETLRFALEAENIECRPLWKPLHLQPVFRQFRVVGGAMSEKLFRNGICLPSGSSLDEGQFRRIFRTIERVMESFRGRVNTSFFMPVSPARGF